MITSFLSMSLQELASAPLDYADRVSFDQQLSASLAKVDLYVQKIVHAASNQLLSGLVFSNTGSVQLTGTGSSALTSISLSYTTGSILLDGIFYTVPGHGGIFVFDQVDPSSEKQALPVSSSYALSLWAGIVPAASSDPGVYQGYRGKVSGSNFNHVFSSGTAKPLNDSEVLTYYQFLGFPVQGSIVRLADVIVTRTGDTALSMSFNTVSSSYGQILSDRS